MDTIPPPRGSSLAEILRMDVEHMHRAQCRGTFQYDGAAWYMVYNSMPVRGGGGGGDDVALALQNYVGYINYTRDALRTTGSAERHPTQRPSMSPAKEGAPPAKTRRAESVERCPLGTLALA